MGQKFQRITEWIRVKGQEETALSYFIQFIYRVFANSFIQAAISILGTIVIAVLIGQGSYGVLFWICVVTYVVATILSTLANEHVRAKNRDTKAFQRALYGIGATMRGWAISLQKFAKELKATKKDGKCNLRKVDFQAAAFAVCETLSSYLSRNDERDEVYVTVYQRTKIKGKDCCRMIAHSAKHEVTSYGNTYDIPVYDKNLFGKVEYHTYAFSSGKKEVTTFHTHELVMDAFCIHSNCEERENEIQQYICIPISPANLGVTFLLQVDTNVPGFFGGNKKAVDDFAKNIIYPYAQLLHMIYEQSRVVEQLVL